VSTFVEQHKQQFSAIVALEREAYALYASARIQKQIAATLARLYWLWQTLQRYPINSSLISCQHHVGLAFTAILCGEIEVCQFNLAQAEVWYKTLCEQHPKLKYR
jgi:hypothetical protein